jgi:tripartite-type tricarboxylate transporter receptor subunit TctC
LTSERSTLFPTLQTAKEQGIQDVDSYFWTAFLFPKNTPEAIVQKLSKATDQILNSPTTIERLTKAGVTAIPPQLRSPDYLQKFVASEMEKWAATIKASGIPVN